VFYDVYVRVCESVGVSPTRVLNDLGISKSSYAHWKKGGEPLNETKKQIADYFGTSVAALMSGTVDEKSIADDSELMAIMQEFKDNPELRTLFSLSKNATATELRQYIGVIKALRGGMSE
jgi:transcriptional regulator with XRE-family HTH domain